MPSSSPSPPGAQAELGDFTTTARVIPIAAMVTLR